MIYEIKSRGPAHSERVTRKREARMREIVRAGLALSCSEGPEGLTIARLAEELDYTPGALYRYFRSKDELVAELQRSVVVYLAQRTREIAERCDAWAEEQALASADRALLAVLAAGLGFEHFARTAPAEFGFLSMHLSDPAYRLPEAEARRVHAATRASLAELERLFERASERGALEPGDPAGRALTTWAALQGVVQLRKLARNEPEGIDVRALAAGLLRTLLVGWGAAAQRVDALLATATAQGLAEPGGSIDDLFGPTPRATKRD